MCWAVGDETFHAPGQPGARVESEIERWEIANFDPELRAERVRPGTSCAPVDHFVEDRHLWFAENHLNQSAPVRHIDRDSGRAVADHRAHNVVDCADAGGGRAQPGVEVGQVEHPACVGKSVGHEVGEEDSLRFGGAKVSGGVRVSLTCRCVDAVQEGGLVEESRTSGQLEGQVVGCSFPGKSHLWSPIKGAPTRARAHARSSRTARLDSIGSPGFMAYDEGRGC